MKLIFLDAVQDFGGSQKSTINLIQNITDHEVLYVDFWGVSKELIENLETNSIKYSILDKREDPIIIREKSKLKSIKNFFSYLLNKRKIEKNINLVINEFNPDYVIVNNLKSLSILSRKSNYKIIFFERTWVANHKISRLKKYYYSKIDYFLAVSNATRAAIYARGLANFKDIFVLQNGIRIEQPYKKRDRKIEKIKILNCGGYLESKGLHHSIEIGIALKNINIDFQIDIVGVVYQSKASQNYFESLQRRIKENNLDKNIFLHTDIKEMHPYFTNANILVHPTYTEGLPRVIMEAMSYSVPVVANPVGGVTDYVLDGFTGLLPLYNNIDDFVEKIQSLKNDIELYNYITYNAYVLIEKKFSNKLQKINFTKFLNQL